MARRAGAQALGDALAEPVPCLLANVNEGSLPVDDFEFVRHGVLCG